MSAGFTQFVGIDYSGAQSPTSRLKGLQVCVAQPGTTPMQVVTPAAAAASARGESHSAPRHWTRSEIALWIIDLIKRGEPALIGIDHGFSFPETYFRRYSLDNWDAFLADFCRNWPTDRDHVYVDFVRERIDRDWLAGTELRVGKASELRLCERWTSSAKSVFQFDVQGQVAKSTHAGIPWLARIRDACGDTLHFWPFDGWTPPEGKSVIAEVYPSIFRNRYEREGRSPDEQDAYAVARWLADTGTAGRLDRYFEPPLNDRERQTAALEGWILGIS